MVFRITRQKRAPRADGANLAPDVPAFGLEVHIRRVQILNEEIELDRARARLRVLGRRRERAQRDGCCARYQEDEVWAGKFGRDRQS